MTQSANNEDSPDIVENDNISPQEEQQQEQVIDDAPDSNEEDNQRDFDAKKRVEFSTPEQQKKFNDIYKQVKMSDSRNKMLMDAIEKQNQIIEELQGRFNQTDHAEAERVLNSRLREAREMGDDEKADKILQEIIDFKAEAKFKQLTKPKEEKKQPKDYDPDVETVVSFAQETDDRGNLLRPWIAQDHPQHQNAMKLASAIAISVNAEYGYVDIPEVMKRMDESLKQKPKPLSNNRAPDPMRGNLTSSTSRSKVNISSKEAEVLAKLNAYLPSDKQIKPEGYMKCKS